MFLFKTEIAKVFRGLVSFCSFLGITIGVAILIVVTSDVTTVSNSRNSVSQLCLIG